MFHMLQNYSRWRVLRPFFDDPVSQTGFTLRGLSQIVGLAPTATRLHVAALTRTGLVAHIPTRPYPTYHANQQSEQFRFYKKMDMLFQLEGSGLLDLLEVRCAPDSIILFGSASRGEDVAGSDIDVFLLASETSVNLKKYEVALKRQISLHFSKTFAALPAELRNNILNGIRLRGYLKVF